MTQHSTMSRIHLELARTPDFPEGSAQRGYEFVAPLTAEGHVDADAWRRKKDACKVTRFRGEAPEEHGRFTHANGGWRFHYVEGEEGDELFFKLDRHTFMPGTYVTINERDGKQYPFRIMAVTPVIGQD